jgi:uncharacterized protein YceK
LQQGIERQLVLPWLAPKTKRVAHLDFFQARGYLQRSGVAMFRRFLISTLSIVYLALLSGCGTVQNFRDPLPDESRYEKTRFGLFVHAGGRQIYGGARSDLVGFYGLMPLEPVFFVGGILTVAVDLPLSLVGDTLTLPWTIQATKQRLAESHQVPPRTTEASAASSGSDESH